MRVQYPKLYNMTHRLALNVLLLPKDLTIIFIFFKYMHVNNALSPQTPKTPGGIPVICSSNRSFQLYKLYLFFLSLQTAYSREKKIKEINYCCVLIVSIKQTRGRPPRSSG